MKALTSLAVLIFSLAANLHGADPWKDQPILIGLAYSVSTTMDEYEWWAEDWKKEKRRPTRSDQSMNLMAETTFIAIQMALDAHPNPKLLEQCLLFLGTTVPPEFDAMWRARFLEMAYLDKAVTKKVDEILKAKRLPTLDERAMGSKKAGTPESPKRTE